MPTPLYGGMMPGSGSDTGTGRSQMPDQTAGPPLLDQDDVLRRQVHEDTGADTLRLPAAELATIQTARGPAPAQMRGMKWMQAMPGSSKLSASALCP